VQTYDELIAIFQGRGAGSYFGERVTVTGHSLQAAYLAENARAPEGLVIAALLHDIGHLIEPAPEDFADWKDDARHEASGSAWLASRFGPEVSEPVRLHVAAKRYLCAVDDAYHAMLSPVSVATLRLQGGPMSRAECAAFESEPHFADAVRLRRWDDAAKVADLDVPGLSHYRTAIENRLRREG